MQTVGGQPEQAAQVQGPQFRTDCVLVSVPNVPHKVPADNMSDKISEFVTSDEQNRKYPTERSWKDASSEDDFFTRFLRNIYFPFLLKFHIPIIIIWLIVFIISAKFGLAFLTATSTDLSFPPGSYSYNANNAMQNKYPNISVWPPAFVLQSTTGGNIVGTYTKGVSDALAAFQIEHDDVVGSVTGYWEYLGNANAKLLAYQAVSPDNQTMLTTIGFRKNASLTQCQQVAQQLIDYAKDYQNQHQSGYTLGVTGTFPLFADSQVSSKADMSKIDTIVLPIALFILGCTVRSYRHVFIAAANIGCAMLLGFAIMIPVSSHVAINPIAPSIMMSLGIAVCFDYSLFMLTRYREECVELLTPRHDAVFNTLCASGHVVCLSGSILFVTFLLLLAFPQNFLLSVGWSCSMAVLSAIIVNMSLTPAWLLTFECLTHFDVLPSTKSCCCYIPAKDPEQDMKARSELAAKLAGSGKGKRTFWFHVAFFVTKYPLVVFIVCLGATAPFLWLFLKMTPTSDQTESYLHGSQSLDAFNLMSTAFNQGALSPFKILITVEGSVETQNYFALENMLIQQLLSTQTQYMTASSVTALSFFNDQNVSLSTSMAYQNPSSSLFHSDTAGAYRTLVASRISSDRTSSLVEIDVIVNPNSQDAVGFINNVRGILNSYSQNSPIAGFPVQMYLTGGFGNTLDTQNALYALIPVEIGAVIAIVLGVVGLSFGSLAITLRLGFTICISLCWTYGMMVLVYQPGNAQNHFEKITPLLQYSSGVFWLIPPMSFSILVGLALDYDIFLMTRVVEFRKMGWSDRASICLAIERTAGIITAAGLIMAVSFAGLLLPKTTVLNQYGFSLFIGVVVDTFIVRPIVVPAAFEVIGSGGLNWWPCKMSAPILPPEEEYKALMAGHSVPRLVTVEDPQLDLSSAK